MSKVAEWILLNLLFVACALVGVGVFMALDALLLQPASPDLLPALRFLVVVASIAASWGSIWAAYALANRRPRLSSFPKAR